MKTTGRFLAAVAAIFLSMSMCLHLSAGCRDDKGWQERMKAERVAYLTSAMDLTPAEAEKFWPVYNSMESERRASFSKVMKAYKALKEALEAGKPENEISPLMTAYVNAMKDSRSVEAKYVPIFSKIISVEKVAKLFVGEEEFRRQQINHWNDKGPGPQGK